MNNKYEKSKRPHDYLPDDPARAIDKSWGSTWAEIVMDEMTNWFYIAMSDEESIYDSFELRVRFVEFYVDLLPFIEATYCYDRIKEAKDTSAYATQHLTGEEENDPMIVIRQFCNKYPLHYVRCELWDFYETIQFYEGPLKERIDVHNTCNMHLHLLTLVEASYLIVGVKE